MRTRCFCKQGCISQWHKYQGPAESLTLLEVGSIFSSDHTTNFLNCFLSTLLSNINRKLGHEFSLQDCGMELEMSRDYRDHILCQKVDIAPNFFFSPTLINCAYADSKPERRACPTRCSGFFRVSNLIAVMFDAHRKIGSDRSEVVITRYERAAWSFA